LGPLDSYRKTQGILRRQFDALTSHLCPTCPEPCCRVPTRVTPLDVALAEACGWTVPPELGVTDAVREAAAQASVALTLQEDLDSARPCPFLCGSGCTFPPDLRPYGCTVFVCKHILRSLDARQRAHLRRLISRLERDHEQLLAAWKSRRGADAGP